MAAADHRAARGHNVPCCLRGPGVSTEGGSKPGLKDAQRSGVKPHRSPAWDCTVQGFFMQQATLGDQAWKLGNCGMGESWSCLFAFKGVLT